MFENQWNKKESPLSTLVGLSGGATGLLYSGAASQKKYVEDVFNTYVYRGDGSAETITHGIDLAGEGGMIWMKSRSQNTNHALWSNELSGYDSQDWAGYLSSDSNNDLQKYYNTQTASYPQVTSTSHTTGWLSTLDEDYVNWTFRKCPGFFDVVKYQGNNNVAQSINHNLGCVPGCIIVKNISAGETENWVVYHKNLSTSTEGLGLNLNTGENGSDWWNSTAPTSTQFTVGTMDATNKDTDDYIAYLFADGDDTDAQIFGDNENESIIKCGGYTGALDINLGWEPQWVLVKNAASTGTGNWYMLDSMRGFAERSTTNNGAALEANSPSPEGESQYGMGPLSSGLQTSGGALGNSGSDWDYIYIAIRRGPMKKLTDATKMFAVDYGNGFDYIPNFDSGFPVDWAIAKVYGSTDSPETITRLTGTMALKTDTNAGEVNNGVYWATDSNVGFAGTSDYTNTRISWMFQRFPGFFDVVCYDGTAVGVQTVTHNLGVIPEMMIHKARTSPMDENWAVYHKDLSGANYYLQLNTDDDEDTNAGMWDNTAPTSTYFTVGNDNQTNANNGTFVAYLFASCPGVSKVGTYTGDGSYQEIDCEFASSARFVLIKRTDDAGDWCVWDSERGITQNADPWIRLNSNGAQLTGAYNYCYPTNSGFGVQRIPGAVTDPEINILNANYIYLAMA